MLQARVGWKGGNGERRGMGSRTSGRDFSNSGLNGDFYNAATKVLEIFLTMLQFTFGMELASGRSGTFHDENASMQKI